MTADDRVRGFPAFPPGRRGRRAQSWWGGAWVRALEDTSLDHGLLTKGRRYAYAGHVGSITVSPGRIAAAVHDGDQDTAYQTRVFVERLTDAQWTRFLDQVVAKAGHIAALLDRDMPHDLVAAADDAGVRLLPGLGDLQPECDCAEWGHPCRHAAALCYQAAWLLDADPFVVLLMRGRGEWELLAEVQRRNVRLGAAPATGGAAGTAPTPGTPAEQAYAAPVPPLPAPPPPPGPVPDRPLVVVPDALRRLADDAADRAGTLLTLAFAGEPPAAVHEWPAALDEWPDIVRIAATGPSGPVLDRLRQASGRPALEFARAVRAWEYGGRAGLAVLEMPWRPATPELARAGAALAAACDGDGLPEPQVRRNRWTIPGHGAQLRYGRDGRWYPYREEGGDWWPAGPPRADPADALADLVGG